MISVIIQCYQAEAFLREAIESVLGQGERPLEIVVVDDGSSDGSCAIAAAEPRVRLLRGPRTGLAEARNRGVATTTGDMVAFLDGDDRWTAGKLRTQLALLARTGAGAALGHMTRFVSAAFARPANYGADQLGKPVAAPIPSALVVRREVLLRVGPFDPTLRVGCDADWMLRLADSGAGVVTAPEVVLEKRIHGTNLSAEVVANQRDLLIAVRRRVLRGRAPARRSP
jgi:glycosyltransferase involved in cell wall biosynthesis